MCKTLLNAATTARDLCRDAYGNGISGQEERSLRYIALAIEQLEALMDAIANRGDTRRTTALETLTRSLRDDTHPAYADFPEFDQSLFGEAREAWEGRSLPNVLPEVSQEHMPAAVLAALKAGKPGEPIAMHVASDDMRKWLEAMR